MIGETPMAAGNAALGFAGFILFGFVGAFVTRRLIESRLEFRQTKAIDNETDM